MRNKGIPITLIIALGMALFTLFKYCSTSQENPITGETQYISMTVDQEIALGLQSAPQMAQQHGGLHPDERAQLSVDQVGARLVRSTIARDTPFEFNFHLLADPHAVNAFALPGGQIFITAALYARLQNENQLAGVLGHEIGHVLARHAAERIAKQELTQGLTGAAVMASYDPGNPASMRTAEVAKMIGNVINMKYGRDQELESDELGVRLMVEAGYNPEALIEVMHILAQASGGQRVPEFQSTHPSPENRVERIQAAIAKYRGA